MSRKYPKAEIVLTLTEAT